MPQQGYLSTDPNAGQQTAPSGYLSTDPNAGQAAEPDGKTVAGFFGNAVRSTGELIGNTVEGARMLGNASGAMMLGPLHPGFEETRRTAESFFGGAERVKDAVSQYFGNRYGSLENVGNTLYEDPAGVAADASTVLSLGGTAAARAPGALGRAGRAMAATGAAVDPTAAATRTAGRLAAPVGGAMDATAGVLRNASGLPGDDLSRFAIGAVAGDPTGGFATALAARAMNSPAVRSGLATGLEATTRTAPGVARTFEANGPMLTRLAVLAALQNQGAP